MPRGVYERTPEYRKKQSAAQKGNQRARGYKHTPEELAAISQASKAHWDDPDYRAQQSASRRRENAGYEQAHNRVTVDRGLARDLTCIDCGNAARHWSLNHERARARTRVQPEGYSPQYAGLPYSLEPSDYDPRCVPCHKRYDLDRKGRTMTKTDTP